MDKPVTVTKTIDYSEPFRLEKINNFIGLWRRINRKNIMLTLGIFFSVLIILIAVFAPVLEPYNPTKMDLALKFIPPSPEHFFGTDNMGRDVFSRIIEGSRISLSTAFLVVFISAFIGTITGLISGFWGGKVDMIFMRIVDVLLAFPTIIFALAISTVLGTGAINLVIAICCIQWTSYARVSRGEAILLKNAEYIEAAKAIGNNSYQIMFKYFLPNIISKILILASLNIGSIILYCASLSFLGLGAQPPSPDWGAMISDGKEYMRYAPWMAIFPGLAIAASALIFNMLGDGIRDLLDPRMREAVKTE
ncbi:ABC transporter permease [Acetobacterium wieringae]|uniref:ABC transporter permease n=1 Tax=Acetobacterium wieringae TaxID=52694 RepID=A0ABY6HHG1_9FIRM|nr:nickel transporter permease [Acetobacterium wieringae]UYO62884.1 ABC transporter permease [Acetobacterium wieringae]VUZ26689.1 Glutathione transport system permease protein GsiD [Acetobacterium wieringae]